MRRTRSDTRLMARPVRSPRRVIRLTQDVTDQADGVNERCAVLLQLATQVTDVGLDHVRLPAEVVVPDVVEYLRLRQDVPGIEHEVAQQVELGRRELDVDAPSSDLMRRLVELEVGEAEHTVIVRTEPGATQDGLHPGDHFGQRERFGDVVVPADRQTRQLVVQRVPGGDEENGDVDTVRPEAGVTSSPSSPGSITSRMTRSGGSSCASESASLPVTATSTSNPS